MATVAETAASPAAPAAPPRRQFIYNPYGCTSTDVGAATATSTKSMSLMDLIAQDVYDLADKFKTEEEINEEVNKQYANLEKSKVLQDSRIFSDSILVRENPGRCCTIIAQLLHLQESGQRLNSTEATEVFFGVTKLFMSDDPALRRMVYLFIKEMCSHCDPSDVIIVTSCLTKDMTCDVDLYRANALRVLADIVDSALLSAIERYVKQSMVDSSSLVATSALISASKWYESSPDSAAVVRRWVREAQEAIASPDGMIQFHALQLLYRIKSKDRLGVSKLVSQLCQKRGLKSPLAVVLLVRYTAKLMGEEYDQGRDMTSPLNKQGYQFLKSSLRHESKMVVYESARAICSLPEIEPQDVQPAVHALKSFLSSSMPTERFASVKTLSYVAQVHPRVVSQCNEDLEMLINDENRSIGTLAIMALLRTGSEGSIDRLLARVSSFLTNITDDYKVMVVKSLEQLCLVYPSKHRGLIAFLSNFLREEGGFEFKKSIVTSIISLMRQLPETTESSLFQLCEFIEDCEFTSLSTQIIHLLAELGPKTTAPSRYIRFIYNRVMLETPPIRAAAVAALSAFASRVPALRESIVPLLKRSLTDEDNETRDRAAIAISVLTKAMEENPYIPPVLDYDDEPDEKKEDKIDNATKEEDIATYLFLEPMPMSFDNLERRLRAYASSPDAVSGEHAVTFDSLPAVAADEIAATSSDTGVADRSGIDVAENGVSHQQRRDKKDPAADLYGIPELAALGRAFHSCRPVDLTELETEYVVSCVKHIFPEHVVFQFKIENTVEDQRLEDVTVSVECSDSDLFQVVGEVPSQPVAYGTQQNCFTLVRRSMEEALTPVSFTCEMHFSVVQVDTTSGEDISEPIAEEYQLESLPILASDFIVKTPILDFRQTWESLGSENEVFDKFALQFKTLDEAVPAVTKFLGMHPCNGTEYVKTNLGGKPHMLHLSGTFVGDSTVLARAQFSLDPNAGVILKIGVRSPDVSVSRLIANCIS